MDVENLIANAAKIGHDEVPIGGGANDSEAAAALTEIFAKVPNKFFKSSALGKLLNNEGIKVSKIGNVLFAMKNAKKCSQVRKGIYISYDAKYDDNMTSKRSSEDE